MRPVQWRHCQLALAQLPVRLGITDAMRVTGAGGSSAISASNPTLLARPCVCNFQLPENESGAGEQGPFVRQEMRVVCDASQQGEHPIRAPSCDLGRWVARASLLSSRRQDRSRLTLATTR